MEKTPDLGWYFRGTCAIMAENQELPADDGIDGSDQSEEGRSTMNCTYCGAPMVGAEIFCRNCGTRQEPQIPEQEAPGQLQVSQWEERELEEQFPLILAEAESQPAQQAPAESASVQRPDHLPGLVLPTGRGLGKMVFLGLVTAGIYPAVIWSRVATEVNLVASRYDGKRTMPFFAMLMLSVMTLGVVPLVWTHRLCRRIGTELRRRDLRYAFGAKDFWLWNVLGGLMLVGPFIFLHKLMKAMNMLNRDFNARG